MKKKNFFSTKEFQRRSSEQSDFARAQHKRTRRRSRRRWASTRRFRQKSFSVLFSCARNSAKSVALNYLVVRKISTLKMPTKVFFIFCIAFLHCQAKGKQKLVFYLWARLEFVIYHILTLCKNSKCNFPIGKHFEVKQQEKIGTI